MIKKVSYTLLTVLIGSSIALTASASEISGTISTDGSNQGSQVTATTTLNSSSEISGQVAANLTATVYDPPTVATHTTYINGGGLPVVVAGGVSPLAINDMSAYTFDGTQLPTSYPDFGTTVSSRGANAHTAVEASSSDDLAFSSILPPLAGGTFGNPNDLSTNAASAITHNGLSIVQLSYLALLGLLIIASMGYAISRTSGRMM